MRGVFGQAFWPRPPWLHGCSSWLVKLLFFRCALAGKHTSSQATTQYYPAQCGCHAEEPIGGKCPAPYILTGANITRPRCHCVSHGMRRGSRHAEENMCNSYYHARKLMGKFGSTINVAFKNFTVTHSQ